MRVWVNFRELREKLRFEDVLRHYKVTVNRKGSQHQGPCPLPGHPEKGKSACFSANLDRGIFQCFGCGAKGNVLDFACLMSRTDPNDGDALRAVAVELQQHFFPRGGQRSKESTPKAQPGVPSTPVIVNAPLNFELKGLEPGHRYLTGRGFKVETMSYFGVGYCMRGLLKERIAIPIHDPEGRLVGYAGRVTDDALVADDNPKYRMPSRRELGGKVYEFRRSSLVYNAHRIHAPCDNLVVVQGFPAVWWLNQSDMVSTVAVMGADCSEEQADIIVRLVKPSGRVWLMPDGNKVGEKLAHVLLGRIAAHRFARWVSPGAGKQPTDMNKDEIRVLFAV